MLNQDSKVTANLVGIKEMSPEPLPALAGAPAPGCLAWLCLVPYSEAKLRPRARTSLSRCFSSGPFICKPSHGPRSREEAVLPPAASATPALTRKSMPGLQLGTGPLLQGVGGCDGADGKAAAPGITEA